MKSLTLQPRIRASGQIFLPGSKSLSLRALLIASVAVGNTRLTNLLRSDDTQRMLQALQALGVHIEISADPTEVLVNGLAHSFNPGHEVHLDLGNSGASIRPLCAMLSVSTGEFHLTGDEHMLKRPIAHLVDGLRQVNADVSYAGQDGFPPLFIRGKQLQGGELAIKGNISSQFLTSLLMTLPLCASPSKIRIIGEQVSRPYLDMTIDVMRRFCVNASHRDHQIFDIPGNQSYQSPGEYMIEGDASSASYFLAAAAIRGGPVRVHGIGTESVQGDVLFADALAQMGAEVKKDKHWIEVRRGQLHGVDLDLNHIPDAAMTLATTALFAEGPTRIRNIYNWRVKETDRMHAMSEGLRKLGATVETGDDFIYIMPPTTIRTATIDTYNDHRIAMSFALAALGDTSITINDPDCTAKTFPDFFATFDEITGQGTFE